MPSDLIQPSPDDPIVRATSDNDIPVNTRHNVGGDVWFGVVDSFTEDTAWDSRTDGPQDIAWDILTAYLQNTSWGIRNENTEDIAWDSITDSHQDISWDILTIFLQNVSWSILMENTRGIAWDSLTEGDQDIAWSIFPAVLFFLKQFYVKAICRNFKTADGETLEEQYSYIADLVMKNQIQFVYQITQPIQFTFGIQTVLFGESETINL